LGEGIGNGVFPQINLKQMELQITIEIANRDGEVVAKRTAYDFAGAEENLGKLQGFIESEGLKVLDEMENREPDEEEKQMAEDKLIDTFRD
jgi:hypothetical protein